MRWILLLLITGLYYLPVAPAPAQSLATGNAPAASSARVPIAGGAAVLGVFEGRFPCQEIARQLKIEVTAECTKIKWRLTLFRDPATGQPTTYKLEGSFFREQARTGPWALVRGSKANPRAQVVQLDSDKPPGSLLLLLGDENVLFILDQARQLRVGTDYLSYTLNRVK
jgi:hypothetical protein